MTRAYRISVTGNAPGGLPADIAFMLLGREPDQICAVRKFPFLGPWGTGGRNDLSAPEEVDIPAYLDLVYLSAAEKKFYAVESALNHEKLVQMLTSYQEYEEIHMLHFIVGMAPYGKVAVWLYLPLRQYMAGWFHGQEIQVDMEDFFPNNPDYPLPELCDYFMSISDAPEFGQRKGELPPPDYFEKLMSQYTYRYVIAPETQATDVVIHEQLYDGTFDKTNDDRLRQYHEAAKPKQIAVKWRDGNNELSAYFWLNAQDVTPVFDRFYGAHHDTKADFIISIDAKNRKYGLSLYRQGLKEPVPLPESAYQLIVFRNRFEDYRSANYSQPRGAWDW